MPVAGAAPADASVLGAPVGISAFYYDTSGGGLYLDRDGGGTGTGFVQFAQLSPVPAPPGIPGFPFFQIVA